METVRSSETSVNFYRTTRRYTAENDTSCSDRCENLESNMVAEVSMNRLPVPTEQVNKAGRICMKFYVGSILRKIILPFQF
jgi:hypothetical protein